MLKITIISVGGMKESYFAEAIAEYEKRASAYAELKNINLKEAPLAATRAGDISAALDAEGEALMHAAFDSMRLSARSYDRILRVSRTIADLAGSEELKREHIFEAIGYRALDRRN